MKKTICFFILLCALPVNAVVVEYFDSFYTEFININKISNKDKEIFDYLYKISNSKTSALENALNSKINKEEKQEIITLIDDEYKDFMENMNFELNYSCHTPPKRKELKKIKKAHRKFMRLLVKCYLE